MESKKVKISTFIYFIEKRSLAFRKSFRFPFWGATCCQGTRAPDTDLREPKAACGEAELLTVGTGLQKSLVSVSEPRKSIRAAVLTEPGCFHCTRSRPASFLLPSFFSLCPCIVGRAKAEDKRTKSCTPSSQGRRDPHSPALADLPAQLCAPTCPGRPSSLASLCPWVAQDPSYLP